MAWMQLKALGRESKSKSEPEWCWCGGMTQRAYSNKAQWCQSCEQWWLCPKDGCLFSAHSDGSQIGITPVVPLFALFKSSLWLSNYTPSVLWSGIVWAIWIPLRELVPTRAIQFQREHISWARSCDDYYFLQSKSESGPLQKLFRPKRQDSQMRW